LPSDREIRAAPIQLVEKVDEEFMGDLTRESMRKRITDLMRKSTKESMRSLR